MALKIFLDFSDTTSHTYNGSNKLLTATNLAPGATINFIPNGNGPTWNPDSFSKQGGYEFRDSENASIKSDDEFTDVYENDHTIFYVIQRQKNWTGSLTSNNTDEHSLDQFPQLGATGWGGYPGGYAAERTPIDYPMIYVCVNSSKGMTNYIDKSEPIKAFTGERGHPYTGLIDEVCIGRKGSDSTAKVTINKYRLHSGAMTQEEVYEEIDLIRTLVDVPQLYRPINVVLDGNSLVQAAGITEDMFPTMVPKLLNLGQHCFPMAAFGGATTPQLITRLNEVVIPSKRQGIKNILFVWEGSNHLNTVDVTPQQACDALEIYAKISLQNFDYVLIGNVLPRKASASGGSGRTDFETDRLGLNTLLPGIASDQIIILDFAATGNGIGDIGDVTGANYNDGTHLSALGSAIAAKILADVIETLL